MDTNYTTARPKNLPAFISTLKYACFDSFPFIHALKENALPIRLCCPRTRDAVRSPVDLTRVAPSGPYLTVPGPPPGQVGGLLCPGPGLHAASTSRNPNSAGRAPHSHPTEAPFWRRRAPAQSPAPRPDTSGTVGQTPRSGPFPQPGCRAPARAQQAARHPGMQGSGAGPGAPSKARAMGRNRQAPPEQGAGNHRGAERGTVSPGRSPQPRSASRPRRTGGHGAPRLPRCRARLPRGPVLPPRCGRALPVERRPSSPVPDAQSRGSKKAKKDAEKGTLL